ncbi:hypothetical protein BN946_scf184915.g6 [Trametes cinnabarina]|uniref:Uncharacterized protein n=1 Tax=Pycnoporus cinnabarinus TaxID=5643 RepID=A0A060SAY7_PYCCI|nr:hypothetical protein BN946_scf184915.g6 [Trametes cinnabarina]
MIFTTVLAACFFALVGVFQQVSVDTFLSSLVRFDAPALSSFAAAFIQVTGSVRRLALDAPQPLPEIDLTLSRLFGDGVTYGRGFANLDLNIPDLLSFGLPYPDSDKTYSSTHRSAYRDPASDRKYDAAAAADEDEDEDELRGSGWAQPSMVTSALDDVARWAYRFGLLCLATAIFVAAESPELKRAATDELLRLHQAVKQQYNDALRDLAPIYQHNIDYLAANTLLRSELMLIDKSPASEPTYCPPSLSTASDLADAGKDTESDAPAHQPWTSSRPSHVFGHARCSGPFTPAADDDDDDKDEEDDSVYDAYLGRALSIAVCTSGHPPPHGWYLDDDDDSDDSAVTGHDTEAHDARTLLQNGRVAIAVELYAVPAPADAG